VSETICSIVIVLVVVPGVVAVVAGTPVVVEPAVAGVFVIPFVEPDGAVDCPTAAPFSTEPLTASPGDPPSSTLLAAAAPAASRTSATTKSLEV
jgi:hypothetical protein